MYHVELRKFPHSFWRFNLSEEELRGAILAPWVHGVPLDAGERRWNPHEATLTVLEGPNLEVQELSMGRGWRNAVRRGEDVTARVIAAARDAAQRQAAAQAPSGTAAGSPAGNAAAAAAAQETQAQLRALLGADARALLGLWQAARERHPERTPSECLALAESAVRSLDDR